MKYLKIFLFLFFFGNFFVLCKEIERKVEFGRGDFRVIFES